MKIGIDLYGADKPEEVIGAIKKFTSETGDNIVAFSKKDDELGKSIEATKGVEVVYCDSIVEKNEDPAFVIRKKKDSTLIVGVQYLADGEIDAFISAGNTGAIVAAGIFVLKRDGDIKKPALPGFLPRSSADTPVMLLDLGANIYATLENMLQYSDLATEYMQKNYKVQEPTIKLLNIGVEENKGVDLQRETYEALKTNPNFKGNIEARDILDADCDIILMDGWTGNIMLKSIEGTVEFMGRNLKQVFYKNPLNKISALFLKKDLKEMYNKLDYRELGATPVLGVNGLLLKAHGSSDERAFYMAFKQAKSILENKK